MRKLLVEDLKRPTSIARPSAYKYPLPELSVSDDVSDAVTPCYESTRCAVHQAPAVLLVCKSDKAMPTGALRLLLSRVNQGFNDIQTTPAFKYSEGNDYAEVQPTQVSQLGTGSVFAFGTSSYVDFIKVRLFWPVESFTMYLITEAELASYKLSPIVIFPPFKLPDAVDPVLVDDFELEANVDLTDDFGRDLV